MDNDKRSLRWKLFTRFGISQSKATVTSEPEPSTSYEEPGDPFADCEPEVESDGGSSVGDHLVDIEDIDLDSQFFSQGFTQTVAECGSVSEPMVVSSSESELEDQQDVEEKERIGEMLSQLAYFNRDYGQCRSYAGEMVDIGTEEVQDVEDVAEVLIKAEGTKDIKVKVGQQDCESNDEWEHIANLKSEEDQLNDVEVIVSKQTTKKGKIIDVDATLRRLLQTEKREKQLKLHQLHLLCLLGHGFHVNRKINEFISNHSDVILELFNSRVEELPEELNTQYLNLICDIYKSNKIRIESLGLCKLLDPQNCYVLLGVAMLRFLAVEARIVMNLDVVSKHLVTTKHNPIRKAPKQTGIGKPPTTKDRYPDVPLTTAEILKRKPEFAHFSQIPQTDGADDELEQKRPRLHIPLDAKPKLWKLNLVKPIRMPSIANKLKQTKANSTKTSPFFSASQRTIKPKPTSKKTPTEVTPKRTLQQWIEVYLPNEKRWIPIDIIAGQVDCLEHVMKLLPEPPTYVFGWSNDGTLQDVTPRYWWQNEMASRRCRVGDKWLWPLLQRSGRRRKIMQDLIDEQEFRRLRYRAPVPEKLSEFKNHPSYCLKRDLLKFQGIYPPDAPPLGFFRDEPIYARECVHTLHSREVWLRHAKTIRLHELPYKVVMSKLRRERTELELFGHWQTEEYVPPEPVDGRVPRNAYGNIEIFKQCMLPNGAVHLKQANISKICRRLRVDYAPAVVGFGIHAGGNHPVFEGIVICKEFERQVLEEYELDLVEQEKRKHERREKRIYDNWKKLIKGLLIRSRLKDKYNFDGL